MFINLSNHPALKWSKEQSAAAAEYGDIVDIPFPSVPAEADEAEVNALAETYAEKVSAMSTPEQCVVMVQGEFTCSFRIIEKLILAVPPDKNDKAFQEVFSRGGEGFPERNENSEFHDL